MNTRKIILSVLSVKARFCCLKEKYTSWDKVWWSAVWKLPGFNKLNEIDKHLYDLHTNGVKRGRNGAYLHRKVFLLDWRVTPVESFRQSPYLEVPLSTKNAKSDVDSSWHLSKRLLFKSLKPRKDKGCFLEMLKQGILFLGHTVRTKCKKVRQNKFPTNYFRKIVIAIIFCYSECFQKKFEWRLKMVDLQFSFIVFILKMLLFTDCAWFEVFLSVHRQKVVK